jgi:hypothetical protein
MLREIRPAILVLGSNDNEAPGSDGNGGNVATSGNVATAAGDDSRGN